MLNIVVSGFLSESSDDIKIWSELLDFDSKNQMEFIVLKWKSFD